jgi:hypothetical protein
MLSKKHIRLFYNYNKKSIVMNKQLLLLSLSFLFISTSIYSQRWEFGVTMKSNYSILDIEDEIYDDAVPFVETGSTGGTWTTSPNINILRSAKSKVGLEMGLRVKYNIMGRISLFSGIEGRFISFKINQRIEGQDDDLYTTLGTFEIPGNPYGVIQGDKILRDQNSSNGITTGEGNYNPKQGLQNLLYLNIPLNIGYTTISDKWTFFGGLWYSHLLQADFEKDNFYPIKTAQYFEKNVIGVNAGIDFKLNSNIAISLNYSGLATNLFARYKPTYQAIPATIFDLNTNTTIVNPHPDAGTVTWKSSDEEIPATQNFNLISLGVTYQLKGK